MIIRLIFLCAGVVILILSGKIAPYIDRVFDARGGRILVNRGEERLQTVPEEVLTEEDILDNKTKWRIIVTGYVVFALVTLFLIISVFTLNRKINTLYGSIQDMENRVNTMETVNGDK